MLKFDNFIQERDKRKLKKERKKKSKYHTRELQNIEM